jgi:hypothetical protein
MSLSDFASLATALGVVLVAVQLWYSRQQARTALEDELSKEYREIALALPPEAFFDSGDGEDVPEFATNLRDYLRYIDLTNQQVFLRSQRRVSRRTWRLWRDGIRDNLTQRPAFREAWCHLSARMGRSFDELKELTREWDVDPAWWDPPWWRRPFKRLRAELGQAD